MSSSEEARVILKCVNDSGKLRIRFDYFIDEDGKVFQNVYNNQYNCRFPRNIRVEGYRYEIPHNDIRLHRGTKQPYYIIKSSSIKIIEPDKIDTATLLENLKIFAVPTCVVCIDEESTMVLLPCGHKCLCGNCSKILTSSRQPCPLCRRTIDDAIQSWEYFMKKLKIFFFINSINNLSLYSSP